MSAEIITTSSALRGLNSGIKIGTLNSTDDAYGRGYNPSPISRKIPMKESMVKKPKSFFLPFKRVRKISQRIKVPPSLLKLRLVAKTVY